MSYLAEKIRSWTFAFTFKPDSSAYKFYIDATNFSLKQIETTIRSFNPEKKTNANFTLCTKIGFKKSESENLFCLILFMRHE